MLTRGLCEGQNWLPEPWAPSISHRPHWLPHWVCQAFLLPQKHHEPNCPLLIQVCSHPTSIMSLDTGVFIKRKSDSQPHSTITNSHAPCEKWLQAPQKPRAKQEVGFSQLQCRPSSSWKSTVYLGLPCSASLLCAFLLLSLKHQPCLGLFTDPLLG